MSNIKSNHINNQKPKVKKPNQIKLIKLNFFKNAIKINLPAYTICRISNLVNLKDYLYLIYKEVLNINFMLINFY